MHRTIAAFLVAGSLALLPMPTPSAAGEETRVLVHGDSIGHGLSGEYTWRCFAWKGLEETGASVDFVGPWRGTYSDEGTFSGVYADPQFDQDHATRYGMSMWETLFWHNSENTPPVEDLMTQDRT